MTMRVIDPTNPAVRNPATPRRRFRVVDAMALVAATALACGITLWIDRVSGGVVSWSILDDLVPEDFSPFAPVVDNRIPLPDLVGGYSVALTWLSLPLFAVLTLALVPMRLLSPRPRFRRFVRQPGTMAAIAASLGIVIAVVQVACTVLYSAFGAFVNPLFILALLAGVASYPGIAVFCVWMTLLAGAPLASGTRLGRSGGKDPRGVLDGHRSLYTRYVACSLRGGWSIAADRRAQARLILCFPVVNC